MTSDALDQLPILTLGACTRCGARCEELEAFQETLTVRLTAKTMDYNASKVRCEELEAANKILSDTCERWCAYIERYERALRWIASSGGLDTRGVAQAALALSPERGAT